MLLFIGVGKFIYVFWMFLLGEHVPTLKTHLCISVCRMSGEFASWFKRTRSVVAFSRYECLYAGHEYL